MYSLYVFDKFHFLHTKCKSGACDEVWYWAILWLTSLQLRIQNEDL